MRTTLPVFVVCALMLLSCGCSRTSSVRIPDVTKSNALNLVSGYSGMGGDLPSGITLHVHGHIDGSASFFARGWETTKLSGTVEWRIYHDWFQTNCVVHYVPESVRSGELTVDYTFH